jgi:hypothetical protein
MAKKANKKTVDQILEETMPGMQVVETPPSAAPDAVKRALRPGPSMDELRRKYLGLEAEDALSRAATEPEEGEDEEDEIEVKRIRRKESPADPVDDPGPRTVIVSKKKGIIGSQG